MKKSIIIIFSLFTYFTAYSQWVTSGSNIYYSSGNVGINGLAGPNTELRIYTTTDALKLYKGSDADKNWLVWSQGNEKRAWRMGHQGSPYNLDLYVGDGTNTPNASSPGSHVMTWGANGKVGIGITNPNAKLHLRNDSGDTKLRVDGGNPNSSDGNSILELNSYRSSSGVGHTTRIESDVPSLGKADMLFKTQPTNGQYLERLRITNNGNVGIGTTSPSNKLEVNGTIRSKKIKVEAGPWPDYVFANDYQPMAIGQLEEYIKKHKHLPEVPSAKEVEENGLDLGAMDATLLKKVEELTLYLIEKDRQVKTLKAENQELKSMFLELKKEIEQLKKE